MVQSDGLKLVSALSFTEVWNVAFSATMPVGFSAFRSLKIYLGGYAVACYTTCFFTSFFECFTFYALYSVRSRLLP